jgi:16S rRNA processing protein RimM
MKKPHEEEYLPIGQVLRPQGLKGEVKVRPDTDEPGRFLHLAQIFVKDPGGKYQPEVISQVRLSGDFVYLIMGGDSDVNSAGKHRDAFLFILREDAVPLKEYENFISELIGCELVDLNSEVIGVLTDVLQPGANDVYVVKTPRGNLLVPALRHVILSVDTEKRLILADQDRLSEVSILED